MRTIDIHSHLAWGIDDGLDSKSNAVEAIQQAKRDGGRKNHCNTAFYTWASKRRRDHRDESTNR